jgi:hypothetical protein
MMQYRTLGRGDLLQLAEDWTVRLESHLTYSERLAKAFGVPFKRSVAEVVFPKGTRFSVDRFEANIPSNLRWVRLSAITYPLVPGPTPRVINKLFYCRFANLAEAEWVDLTAPVASSAPAALDYDPTEEDA